MSFVRCPECGFCIGEYYEFIIEAQRQIYDKSIYNKNNDISPEKIEFNQEIMPDIKVIFDTIGINNMCCRMHLIAYVDIYQRFV